MASSKCIVCLVDIVVSNRENEDVSQSEKAFDILCDYFSLCADNGPWDFKSSGVPLCNSCQEIGTELCSLQDELEVMQGKILKIIAIISSRIMETPAGQLRKRLSGNVCVDLDENIARKVYKFQSLVRKQYTPQLVVDDCSSKISTKRKGATKPVSNKKKKLVEDSPSSSDPIAIDVIDSELDRDRMFIKEEDDDFVTNLNDDSWNELFSLDKETEDDSLEISDVEWTHSNDDDEEEEVATSSESESGEGKKIDRKSSNETKVQDDNDGVVPPKPKAENMGGGYYMYAGKYGFNKVGTRGVKCQTCGIVMKFRTHIYRHIKELHMGLTPNKFKCTLCGNDKYVGTLKVFKNHLSKFHTDDDVKGKIITCGQDKFVYDGQWFFQKSQQHEFTCIICATSCDSQESILDHFQSAHNGQLTCNMCGKGGFSTKRALVGHKNNMHRGKKRLDVNTTANNKKRDSTKRDKNDDDAVVNESSPVKQDKPERIRSEKLGGGRYMYNGKYGFIKNSKKMCTCEICGLEMNLTHIHRHMRHKHMGLAPTKFSCSICGKSLTSLKSFLNHQNILHPRADLTSEIVVCGDGKFLVDRKWVFEKTSEGSLKCGTCGTLNENQEMCIEHARTHQFVSFTCDECQMEFESNRALMRHKSNHDGTKEKKARASKTTIQNSDQQFVYRGQWKFVQVEGGYKCSHCGIFFISRNGMQNHLKHSHAEPTPDSGVYLFDGIWKYEKVDAGFRCLTCSAVRKLKGCMDQHIKERHVNPCQHVCEVCGRGFSSKQSFEYHTAKHSLATPYMCEDCGSRHRNKDELRQHRLSHKSWPCSECDKVFSGNFGKSNMYHHKKRWHSTKKIECFICQKTFLYKSELTQHLTTHNENNVGAGIVENMI